MKNKGISLGTVRKLDASILPAYKQLLKQHSPKARRTLDVLSASGDELADSNPFACVELQNSGILPAGTRLATRDDLELALKHEDGQAYLRNRYVDVGLALRPASDSYKLNDLLAKILAKQLKQQGIALGNGVLIPFAALTQEDNEKSDYGLVFNLKLNVSSFVTSLALYDWNYDGGRGLSRAVLGGVADWGSDGGNLASFSGGGRVIVVR